MPGTNSSYSTNRPPAIKGVIAARARDGSPLTKPLRWDRRRRTERVSKTADRVKGRILQRANRQHARSRTQFCLRGRRVCAEHLDATTPGDEECQELLDMTRRFAAEVDEAARHGMVDERRPSCDGVKRATAFSRQGTKSLKPT